MKERLDGYAFEVVHGANLCIAALEAAMLSAVPALKERHPELAAAIARAENALVDLYQTAALAWDNEAPQQPEGEASGSVQGWPGADTSHDDTDFGDTD